MIPFRRTLTTRIPHLVLSRLVASHTQKSHVSNHHLSVGRVPLSQPRNVARFNRSYAPPAPAAPHEQRDGHESNGLVFSALPPLGIRCVLATGAQLCPNLIRKEAGHMNRKVVEDTLNVLKEIKAELRGNAEMRAVRHQLKETIRAL